MATGTSRMKSKIYSDPCFSLAQQKEPKTLFARQILDVICIAFGVYRKYLIIYVTYLRCLFPSV